MTHIPTVGRIVHYQSYGTPGGEYLPEPRAAIVTTRHPEVPGMGLGLAIMNPTGMFFNQLVPFSETPGINQETHQPVNAATRLTPRRAHSLWPAPKTRRVIVMARAKKICPKPQQGRYCPEHNAAHDKARGTTQARGYGSSFQAQRREYTQDHQHCALTCWRCGKPIPQGKTFHLGHDDDNRDVLRGPEHPLCNLEAAGRSSHTATTESGGSRGRPDPRGEGPSRHSS